MGIAAAAKQQRDPSRDVISAPPAAGARCGWVLLDPRAVTGGFGTGSAAPSPTAAASVASNGRIVRVSLHLVPPPGESYVELEVVSGDPFIKNPTVVAADGDLLLMLIDIWASTSSEMESPRGFTWMTSSCTRPIRRVGEGDDHDVVAEDAGARVGGGAHPGARR
ncbi:unnamed protein product [Urochloa humidicola]